MDCKKELTFVENFSKNYGLKVGYIKESDIEKKDKRSTIGLQDILNYKIDKKTVWNELIKTCKPNTIYRIKNELLCRYILFELPNKAERIYAYIGPYTLSSISKSDILCIAKQYKLPVGNLAQVEQFYADLPFITDETPLLTLLYTLGEYLWKGADNFTISDCFQLSIPQLSDEVVPIPDVKTSEEALLSMQILEERYEVEQQLIQAVTNGHLHKAELALAKLASRQFESRANTPIGDYRNYSIILNTLLRKAAEDADVHPIVINEISSRYAKKIELINSHFAFSSLTKEMVRKYCLTVKNHSLKGYSMLVRKVINTIQYDLSADLSLKAQAKLLNVNPSYLSTLFKKETGSTLTEYVNRKRIEHALLLLNSTDMQVQTIAAYCGIPDVNYFTKLFKKQIGKTPTEYREMLYYSKPK